MSTKDNLYDWLFHYNHHTNLWSAFKRSDLQDYFNGTCKNVLRSEKQSTLEELIIKTDGDSKLIKEIVKDK